MQCDKEQTINLKQKIMKKLDDMIQEMANKGYTGRLSKEFRYSVDKDNTYKTIYIDHSPDEYLIKLANQYQVMWCAVILHSPGNDFYEGKISYHTMPSDMKSFDFGEIKDYYVKEATEYGCTVYQVINSSTGVVAYYDKDKDVADSVCNKWNK